MEVINPFIEDINEIKVCRLCGTDNEENIDIFSSKTISSRSENLLTKILAVYPLVLYKDDPLPQFICPKCIGNVSTTYQDIQQVLRQQNKWMSITKAVQPEHKYFRILNAIENSTKATKDSIKTSYNIDIYNIPMRKLLSNPTKDIDNSHTTTTTTTNTNDKLNINENMVKNIQTKLESNGFTIKRIKVATKNNVIQDLASTKTSTDFTGNYLRKSANVVSCNYCKQKFSDLKILAQHQLIHLKLSINKVFQKRLLNKQLRRGRLITLNDTKCIRCLNCWRTFKDNKTILQHWSGGECDFYCFVCGKEYPHSPKMLREHVAGVHGLNYRSANREIRPNISEHNKSVTLSQIPFKNTNLYPKTGLIKKKVYKKPPPKSCTKNEDGTIVCKICHKVFDNFRSSNSHMRKHKPPKGYTNQASMLKAREIDKYNMEDDYMAPQPSTSDNRCISNYPSATENFMQMKTPRPAYRVIMKNGPLRGIKTKIVQKRQDFLSNYGKNDRPPTETLSDRNDNENMIVPELLIPAIKTEPDDENETQDKRNNGLEYGAYENAPAIPAIKIEPLDSSGYVPESQDKRFCFICSESFPTHRDYELHTMFVHNIN